MIVAVGDIHGYRDKLVNVMSKLNNEIKFETDTVVFLGDYVDGGPDTADVIEILMGYERLYPHWKFIYGNHEDLMLDALIGNNAVYGSTQLWTQQGGNATLKSYRASVYNALDKMPSDHVEWLNSRPLTHETDEFIFVHAGLQPGMTVDETPRMDKLWIREDFLDSDYDWGKFVVAGHSFHKKPLVREHLMCIDCVHHGGGNLHAVLLDKNAPGVYKYITSE